MKKKLLMTGGSGKLGSVIIELALKEDRFEVSAISTDPEERSFPSECDVYKADLKTGEGLENALKGVQFVIHCASRVDDAQRVDLAGTSHLLKALDKSTIENLVYVSIVGIDHSTHPYYVIKLKTEQLIAESGMPYSVLRATQFHEYIVSFIKRLDSTPSEISVPTGLKFQPIAIPDLAGYLLTTLHKEATGSITSVGGPEIKGLEEMTEAYLKATGSRQQLKRVDASQPLEFRFRTGANLVPDASYGKVTWADFLATARPTRKWFNV